MILSLYKEKRELQELGVRTEDQQKQLESLIKFEIDEQEERDACFRRRLAMIPIEDRNKPIDFGL